MPPPDMEVGISADALFAGMEGAYYVFCTAPRYAVDFLKQALLTKGHFATFNRPGDPMDMLDNRLDWWMRWQTSTAAAGIAGAVSKGVCE
eukprot:11567605-Karenia_brevis.AAC.1